MPRKSGPGDPPPPPTDDEIHALEQRLEVARQDPTQRALAQILAWRLAGARGEPRRLEMDLEFMQPLRLFSARLVGGNDADDVAQDALESLLLWMQEASLAQIQALMDSKDGIDR